MYVCMYVYLYIYIYKTTGGSGSSSTSNPEENRFLAVEVARVGEVEP
jgi:hypothetical protein